MRDISYYLVNKVVKKGINDIRKRSTTITDKNGSIAFEISSILLLAIAPETIRQIPSGGVNIPIARFVTIITPLVNGSTPKEFKSGSTTGVKSIKEAVVSTNVPISSKKRLTKIISAILS